MSRRPYNSVESLRNRDAFRADESVRQAGADMLRGEFLRKLDDSDLDVTHFEADFLNSFLLFSAQGPEANWWTPGRRRIADELQQKYGGRL